MTTAVSQVSIEKRRALISLDATGGDLAYTVGDATVAEQYVLTEFFRLDSSGNAMTVSDGGSLSLSLVNAGDSAVIFSDGTAWRSKQTATSVSGSSVRTPTTGTPPRSGAAVSATSLVKYVQSMTDATFTDLFTVSVPNAKNAGALFFRALGVLGDGDSSAADEYIVAIVRQPGEDTITGGDIVTTSVTQPAANGSQTIAMTFQISAITGSSGAAQTFTVQGKIARGGGSSDHHNMLISAELLNQLATGITMG